MYNGRFVNFFYENNDLRKVLCEFAKEAGANAIRHGKGQLPNCVTAALV